MVKEKEYFVALDNEVYGPYTLNELYVLGLLPDTLVSTFSSEWMPASEYPELRYLLNNQDSLRTQREMPLFDNRRILYKQKKKAALIGVCTLGVAGLAMVGIGETWRSNIFAGTSFDKGGGGFVMKVISFVILSVIVAIPFFFVSLFQLVYYSVKLSSIN